MFVDFGDGIGRKVRTDTAYDLFLSHGPMWKVKIGVCPDHNYNGDHPNVTLRILPEEEQDWGTVVGKEPF